MQPFGCMSIANLIRSNLGRNQASESNSLEDALEALAISASREGLKQ
jgi:hypothetical protein